ncbi:hypothetical protein CRG98_047879 [Punica granatum]|uniref:Uncharacterized protein n=1 Tax=Punica granatum TaxID=22663 RepID=A0A2I0HK86_PUNGR|nr:hypothetical protein CRG98_047879 [Punica granatum]
MGRAFHRGSNKGTTNAIWGKTYHSFVPTDVIICEKNGVVPQVIWPPAQVPMEWDYPGDYQRTCPSLEQALKEYNEENLAPSPASQDQHFSDSQDPYSPDPEALIQLEDLMQLDLNPPTADQAQPNSTA